MAGDRYCQAGDLLIGSTLALDGDLDKFVNEAADQMDSRLGEVYELPLGPTGSVRTVESWRSLKPHVVMYLKRCNVHLATGRFLMASSSRGQEGEDAYAIYLLREGEALLAQMVNGQINLGAEKVEGIQGTDTGPTIYVGDSTSAVDHYYDFVSADPLVNAGLPPESWRPGVR